MATLHQQVYGVHPINRVSDATNESRRIEEWLMRRWKATRHRAVPHINSSGIVLPVLENKNRF